LLLSKSGKSTRLIKKTKNNNNGSCQLVIMFTPVRNFFKVEQQNGAEWAFAIGVGAGSLVMSLVVKLLTR